MCLPALKCKYLGDFFIVFQKSGSWMKLRTRTIHFAGDNTAQATQTQKYPGQRKNILFSSLIRDNSLDSWAEPQSAARACTLGKWSERQLEPKGGAYEKGRGTVTCLEMLGNAFKWCFMMILVWKRKSVEDFFVFLVCWWLHLIFFWNHLDPVWNPQLRAKDGRLIRLENWISDWISDWIQVKSPKCQKNEKISYRFFFPD